MLEGVWPSMTDIECSLFKPPHSLQHMHPKLTKHGRFSKQNNQLPTKSHDELKDNSNVRTKPMRNVGSTSVWSSLVHWHQLLVIYYQWLPLKIMSLYMSQCRLIDSLNCQLEHEILTQVGHSRKFIKPCEKEWKVYFIHLWENLYTSLISWRTSTITKLCV